MSIFGHSNTITKYPTTTKTATTIAQYYTATGFHLTNIDNRNLFLDVLFINISHFWVSLSNHIFSSNGIIYFQFNTLMQLQ